MASETKQEKPLSTSALPRPKPFVVVLTGGPCSGKSSALALLRDRLSVRGFQVLAVPENATHFLANSDGFQPEWVGTSAQAHMQRLFLDFQIYQEDAFKEFGALHPRKPCVLLLDRCTLDSKIFVSSEQQWQDVLSMPGKPTVSEADLVARYDLVIHAPSAREDEQGLMNKALPHSESTREDEQGMLNKATDITYERRTKVHPPRGQSTAQGYLTRKIITADEYQDLQCPSQMRCSRFVLGFVEGAQYYEIFSDLKFTSIVLDMPEDVRSPPTWVKLNTSRDLKQNDTDKSFPCSPLKRGRNELDELRTDIKERPRRILKVNSTEEAALFGGC